MVAARHVRRQASWDESRHPCDGARPGGWTIPGRETILARGARGFPHGS